MQPAAGARLWLPSDLMYALRLAAGTAALVGWQREEGAPQPLHVPLAAATVPAAICAYARSLWSCLCEFAPTLCRWAWLVATAGAARQRQRRPHRWQSCLHPSIRLRQQQARDLKGSRCLKTRNSN